MSETKAKTKVSRPTKKVEEGSAGQSIDLKASTLRAKSKKPLDISRLEEDTGVSDKVWNSQKDCLLLLLQARMLLREMVEYRCKMQRIATGNLSIAEIQNLLMLHDEAGDQESDLMAEIEALKRQLAKEIRDNYGQEKRLKTLEKKIALLIQNRTTIQEIDKEWKKARRRKAQPDASEQQTKVDFTIDRRIMEQYSNLFYLLQTEPKYLAKLVYLVQPEQMESFVDTLILSLYGDAFSPREEYLILKLFQLAILNEIQHNKSGVTEFTESDSVIPKMFITYNKRKLGVEYLKNTMGPILKDVVKEDISYEMKATMIYNKLITDEELKTGKKSTMNRTVTADEAAEHPKVKELLEDTTSKLTNVCQKFLDGILNSLGNVPYGLRLICKQMKEISLDRFPKSKTEQINQVIGYFVYYRFINLAIVTPDEYNIGGRELSINVRKNLVVVSKILQKAFDLTLFRKNHELYPLNKWIEKSKPRIVEYFNDLIEVPDAEEYLQVDKYNELTQKTSPLIIITPAEIVETHTLLNSHVAELTDDKVPGSDKEDPLKIILKDLGQVPSLHDVDDDKEIQLVLENRFKGEMEDLNSTANLYAHTKELVIQIFRMMPIKASQKQTLMTILKAGKKFAKETNNKILSKNINKVLENIKTLEASGKVTKEDRYTSFLKDIALEVANRAERREQQRKEIARLQAALKGVKKIGEFMKDQISEFDSYLKSCRENSGRTDKKSKSKPHKFSYKELQKKGVIIDSEVPAISRGRTKFFISMSSNGVFDVEAKIAGLSVGKMQLELDDLLERKENAITKLDLEQVTLDVNMTIFLINKLFLV